MTNEEILEKAIGKAVKNGYSTVTILGFGSDRNGFIEGNIRVLVYEYRNRYREIIFSHYFAKAFWGEEDYTDGKIVICNLKAWQYHLQQMVLEEEPLKYLERFCDKRIN